MRPTTILPPDVLMTHRLSNGFHPVKGLRKPLPKPKLTQHDNKRTRQGVPFFGL